MGQCSTCFYRESTEQYDDDESSSISDEDEITSLPTDEGNIEYTVQRHGYTQYAYPFENLAFEGGGVKGYSYVGALQVLKEVGITQQICRVSGSSIGSVAAMFLAVGGSWQELAEFVDTDLTSTVYSYLSCVVNLIPNVLTHYGWWHGKKMEKLFGDFIQKKTGNSELTFKQLYDRSRMELCIVATNLHTMEPEYFHVKTTPNMPIKTAMICSVCLPGLMIPTEYKVNGHNDLFVDGGLTCNFPLHVFDGWWLSLKPEDSFFRKLRPIANASRLMEHSERFGTRNPNTIGIQLAYRYVGNIQLFTRLTGPEESTLRVITYQKYRRRQKLQRRTAKHHCTLIKAIDAFFDALNKHDANNDQRISLAELRAAFADRTVFKIEHAEYLFGPDTAADDMFRAITADGNDEIDYLSLAEFIESSGVQLQSQYLGYMRRTTPINSFLSFCQAIQKTLVSNLQRIQSKAEDVSRTVGINTGYITSTDFVLEQEDKDFLIEQGRRSVAAFLRDYTSHRKFPVCSRATTNSADAINKFAMHQT